MQIERTIRFKTNDSTQLYRGEIVRPEICPICKTAFTPDELSCESFQNNKGEWHFVILYKCPNCSQVFVVFYSCVLDDFPGAFRFYATPIYVEPHKPEEASFSKRLIKLSPCFAKVYNQALAAESFNLDEIAGIGYRKALEYLVKDYCIHLEPSQADSIRRAPLGPCISNRIDNAKIKALAKSAVWIGNDETHYVRKHTDRDIQDMKTFIEALVYFISMSLTVEDAESITSV